MFFVKSSIWVIVSPATPVNTWVHWFTRELDRAIGGKDGGKRCLQSYWYCLVKVVSFLICYWRLVLKVGHRAVNNLDTHHKVTLHWRTIQVDRANDFDIVIAHINRVTKRGDLNFLIAFIELRCQLWEKRRTWIIFKSVRQAICVARTWICG